MVFVALETYSSSETHMTTSVTKLYKDRNMAIEQIEQFLIELEEGSDSESDEFQTESSSESSGSESDDENLSSDEETEGHTERCINIRRIAKRVWEGEPREIDGDICNPNEGFYLEIEYDKGFYCLSLEEKEID